jgi:hypothetical protein
MTGTTLPSWPAFALGGQPLPQQIGYERGVWGKVHGARSDYRWIATTASFAPAKLQLENELRLGTEDAPRKATHWRNLGDQCLAMVSYPSRATDAAGRSGFLEKQVFAWRRPPETPAALGALVLLPKVAHADDNVWWERRTQRRWMDEDETLVLAPPDYEPFPVKVDEILSATAAGIADLARAVPAESLADLYAHLLAGHRAIPLPGLSEPLGPAALAVLLLPLQRAMADGLSLAGWLPSQRIDLKEIQRCWNLALGGATPPPAPSPPPSAELRRQGGVMARALLANDPAALSDRPVPAKPRATATPGGRPVQLAIWGPSSSGKTALVAKLYLEDQDTGWEIFPTEKSMKFIHDMRAAMRSSNLFPKATVKGKEGEQIEYLLRHKNTGAEASLRMEDRAGSESETLSDPIRRQLGEANGLVLLFDPAAEGIALESQVWKTLEHVHVASGRGVHKDDRPIAVCVSKADLLIETVEDLRSAIDDPDGFVRRHDKMNLVRALDRFCTNYKLFPVSAAGIRLRHGVVEPVVFYDETLLPRIGPGGQPLNVMAPFAWLLDQVTNRS